MSTAVVVLLVVLLATILLALLAVLSRLKGGANSQLPEKIDQYLSNANNQLVLMADQKLKAEKQEIASDLANKKEMIEKLVKDLGDNLNQVERQRLSSFSHLATELENNKKMTEQLSVTTENLRKVLSNNQLRGQFGEQVAEDLMRMAGFVRGTDYEFNKAQDQSSTRPDFTVFLPDGSKVNVDAKFPYKNLQNLTESDDEGARAEYLKKFRQDIKAKIKQVSTRDYINPAEKTVDFVILFIPNEMIFSFIYEKMNDVWEEAMQNKVVMAGPFSFTAILRMVKQAQNAFKYQQKTGEIISLIRSFEEEFAKYNQEFMKIGAKIQSLSNQYEVVDSTRTRQLVRTVDKITQIEPDAIAKAQNVPVLEPATKELIDE